jgi:hypothetical protein
VENEMQSFLQAVLDRLPKPPEPATPAPVAAAAPADGAAMDTDGAADAAADANGGAPPEAAAPSVDPAKAERLARLLGILAGTTPIGLTLEFLYHNNHADLQVGWGQTERTARAGPVVGIG